MLRWHQLKDAETLPASFQPVWKEKCAARTLDKASFEALREWMMTEAAQARRWALVAESSPCSPGLTLHLCPMRASAQNKAPRLRISLDGTDVFRMREEWRYEKDRWSQTPARYQVKEPSIAEVIEKLEEHMPDNYEKKPSAGVLRLIIAWDERRED
jgi:hypothetical protein